VSTLWTIEEICRAANGRARDLNPDSEISGVSIDSRAITKGDLFVAIKGDRFDGHDFVGQALKQGASAALVSERYARKNPNLKGLIVVDDALKGLGRLGVAARKRMQGTVIAVTGSVGKTSTKEAIRITLQQFGKTHYSIKSFNNHWGVPLMLARMPADTDFGVFELGMSHAGEIRPLAKMVRPHISVITKIAPAHLENFKDLYGIAAAKAEIFEGQISGGKVFLGADHDYVAYLTGRAAGMGKTDVTSYGFSESADCYLDQPVLSSGNISCMFSWQDETRRLRVPQMGAHALPNAAVAYLVGEAVGLESRALIDALTHYVAPTGRGQLVSLGFKMGNATLVDESYNANPTSMQAALDMLSRNDHKGRTCVILGEMLELGSHAADLHRALAGPLLQLAPKKVFLVGPLMKNLRDELGNQLSVEWLENRDGLLPKLANWLAPGDLVMVKGSNGIGLGALVEACREKWPPKK
jgi:UDP-N-acetylmuramoyl-tripeptide--D-alanyl-D-alanine ligase